MSKTISELLGDANVIKAELTQGKNTADRVGTMLIDIIEYMKTLPHSIMQTIDTGADTYKTKIDGDITSINSDIEQALRDIDELRNSQWNYITQVVQDVVNGEGFMDGWYAGWVNKLQAYLISVGVLDPNGNMMWSTISTKVDSIDASVSRLNYLPDNLEMFNSKIHEAVSQDSAIIEIKASYALTDTDKKLLRWLETGLDVYVDEGLAINSLFATASDIQEQSSATAALTQRVEEIDGKLTTTNELVSNVEHTVNGITEEISAGVITKANLDREASVTLFAETSQTRTQLELTVEGIMATGNYLKLDGGQLSLTRDGKKNPAFQIMDNNHLASATMYTNRIEIEDNYDRNGMEKVSLSCNGLVFDYPLTDRTVSGMIDHNSFTSDESLSLWGGTASITLNGQSNEIVLDEDTITLKCSVASIDNNLNVGQNLTVGGTFSAGSFSVSSLSLDSLTVGGVTINSSSISVSGITINSNGISLNSGNIVLNNSEGLKLGGSLPIQGVSNITANGRISAYGDITTSNGNISAGGNITASGNVSCSSIGSTNGYLVNGAIGKTGSFEDKNGNIIRVSGGIIISLS